MIPQHLKLHQATLFDINRIYEIEKESFDEKNSASKEDLEKAILENQIYTYVICNQMVGYIWLINESDKCYIESIAVDPTYRNRGYGKEMILRSLLFLKQCDIKKCTLHVDATNKIACKLYENLGFNYIDFIYNFYGENKDANLMGKSL